MAKLAIWAVLESKEGKEAEVEEFLKSAAARGTRRGNTHLVRGENCTGEVCYLRYFCGGKRQRSSPYGRNRKGPFCKSEGTVCEGPGDSQG